MALSSKSPNAIFMEIRKLSTSSPPPILYDTLSQLSYTALLASLPLFDRAGQRRFRASSSRRRIRFASNRAKADQRSLAFTVLAQRNSVRASIAVILRFVRRFREKGDFPHLKDNVRNNCSRNIRVAIADDEK